VRADVLSDDPKPEFAIFSYATGVGVLTYLDIASSHSKGFYNAKATMTKAQQHFLGGLNIAILLTDGFEQVELTSPRQALEESGVTIRMLSDKTGRVQGYHHDVKGDLFDVDMTFDRVTADEFDAVLLPGGAVNSNRIRNNADAQLLISQIDQQGKPVAVICHGAWLLVSADLVKGHKMTSWPSLREDIESAGGQWIDEEVVVDGSWISSRKPDDLPAFNAAFMAILGKRTGKSIIGTADDVAGGASAGMGG